jgi:predicted AlkP superfamily phosphohydrolase/phosphomutase
LLAILHVDALSLPLLEQLVAEGRMPVFKGLRERGRWHTLETPATHLPAATYFSMYSGHDVGDHGLYFPFQWSASAQRLRYRLDFGSPTTVWERLAAERRRSLVIDPYELAPPTRLDGLAVSGWQMANILSLQRWSVPRGWHRAYQRRFGRGPSAQEVFGRRSVRMLFSMRGTLLRASARVARLATELLRRERFDLVSLTFLAPHHAGHVFWDVSQLEIDDAARARFEGTLPLMYEEADRALGQVVAALPDDSDLIVVSPLGMGPNRSRIDLLGEMLEAVLEDRRPNSGETRVQAGSRIWRLRAAIPTSVRANAARALGGPLAREVTARLSTSGIDWRETRAFLLPSDENGLIQLNLRGRERDGIVNPAEAESLVGEITEGLLTFHELDGGRAVAGVDRATDVFEGRRSGLLPDLIVRWPQTPSTGIEGVSSERFGDVRRLAGGGTGRNGGHTGEAWALVVPGVSKLREPSRPARVVDIAATVYAAFGVDGAPPGEPLLEPS